MLELKILRKMLESKMLKRMVEQEVQCKTCVCAAIL
jgi:hypothetical protein